MITPSFGDISGNAVQNGLLTAAVPDEVAAKLISLLDAAPKTPVTIDLERQIISCGELNYVHPAHIVGVARTNEPALKSVQSG